MGKVTKDVHDQTVDKNYDFEKNLNWRDDGDILMDPSVKEYIKGYEIDPYEMRYWAKKNKGFEKKAWTEVDVTHFSPEYLADKIVKLWRAADGLLQNFYESFTLRFPNKLKMAVADELMKMGYKVYPLLIEDKPIYADSVNRKLFKQATKSNDVRFILAYIDNMIAKNEIIAEFLEEAKELVEEEKETTKIDVESLVEYYKQIYPEEYAIRLVEVMIKGDKEAEASFNLYRDFNLSDESLEAMESYMSGNADPFYTKDGGEGGYNFVSDTRNDTTAPGLYEIRVSKKKLD